MTQDNLDKSIAKAAQFVARRSDDGCGETELREEVEKKYPGLTFRSTSGITPIDEPKPINQAPPVDIRPRSRRHHAIGYKPRR